MAGGHIMVLSECARLMKGFSQVKQRPCPQAQEDHQIRSSKEIANIEKKKFQTFAGHKFGWKSETVWLFKGKRAPSRHLYYVRMEKMRFRKVDSTAHCPTAGKTQWGSNHFWCV